MEDRFTYGLNPEKLGAVSSYLCDQNTAPAEFLLVKSQYHAETGRAVSRGALFFQIRQAFLPGEVTAEEANRIGYETAIDHPELCIVDEFVDDGYSGSNFERPAFQRLFQELEQGTINCILVKDLSRFGRNYIEVGRYLERIFPVMRVRLIAVTDNYDSQSAWKTSDSIMVPMRNLLNDAYCRDISVKIKSQLAVKRKRGDFVGSFAAYGYRKDPANHTKLIVDELAAENVQSIFRWKISGMNNQGIANRLNAKKVSSPAARKLQSGAKLSLHFRKSDEPPWSAKAVDRILHNEVYIGKLVQGKTRRLDYRSKKKMNVPMRDWVIVDNTHEAIIPAEQFELVQRILETETRRPNDAETVALFAGFLYCGDCGSRLWL